MITGTPIPPPAPVRLRASIDEPRAPRAAKPLFQIRGWCFDQGGVPLTGVRGWVNSRMTSGSYGWQRNDVRAAYQAPAASAASGFGITLRLLPGPNLIRLEAQFAEHAWFEFQRWELTLPWGLYLAHRLRLARFWIGAVSGRPSGAAALTAEERTALVSEIDQGEGHPLRVGPHYPPRPVAIESFPLSRLRATQLPKVTIVTPSFRQGAFLEATLRSILSQPGVRLDYIVQDGGSADNTPEVLRRYAPRLVRCVSEPDGGQADAIRRGFAHLNAGPDDIMAYVNSDDLLMPGTVRFVADYFARHPQVDVVYGHRVLIDEAGQEVGRWFTPRASCDDLRFHDLIPQETLFWRRRLWDRVGGIDPDFQFALDWDLLLRFKAAGARMQRLPYFLGLFRLHPQQKSQEQLQELGVPEMDGLRVRALGRPYTRAEFLASAERAQLESTIVRAAWRQGWRL